jgi:phosphohistidine phosphatase SixA
VALLLVRHGTAGRRSRWKGDDRARPLDKRGRKQAQGLVENLGGYPVTRVLSSPYLRCVQTVQPLAEQLGLEIEERSELAEGASPTAVHALLRDLVGQSAVLCSHGDIIADLVGWERRQARKGATWLLEPNGDRFAPAVYLPPTA